MKIKTSLDWVEILSPIINARGECVDSASELVQVFTLEELHTRLLDFKRFGWPVWIAGDICYVFVGDEQPD